MAGGATDVEDFAFFTLRTAPPPLGGPHPTPYTLHPSPYTLQLTPYTLHPTPYTLHPTPYTLHPAPCTLHPTPDTKYPKPFRAFAVREELDQFASLVATWPGCRPHLSLPLLPHRCKGCSKTTSRFPVFRI